MAAQVVLIAVLIVVAAAAAVPFVWLERTRTRRRRDANVLVLGGAVLGGGQGVIAFGVFAANAGDIQTWALALPPLSVAAALFALWAAFRLAGLSRRALLLGAAALSLGGSLSVLLFPVSGVASFVAALCYLAGLSDNPRDVLRRLDPRE